MSEINVQPQAIESEQAVLGSMLNSPKAVPKALQWLKPQHFYSKAHQEIFKTMSILFNDSENIDTVTVIEKLKKRKKLNKVGGAYFVTSLQGASPSASNVEGYAKVVLDKAKLRELIEVGHELTAESYKDEKEVGEILDSAEQKIFSITQSRLKGGFVPAEDIAQDCLDEFDRRSREGGIAGIPTGLTNVDNLTAGIQKGELTILAARPSIGKTAYALTVASNIAKNGKPVGFFSLEMRKEELVTRLIIAEAKVNGQHMRTGKLEKDDWQKVMDKTPIVGELPIYIDDTTSMTVTALRSKATRLKSERNVDVIIVDYLQLLTGSKAENRTNEVANITRALKAMAKDLNVSVIALSQLSRAVEQRTDKKPVLSDLRDSGSIEQDADLVMFLYRDYYYTEKDEDRGKALVIVAKQRNGQTGHRSVVFYDAYAKFDNIDTLYG